ncbi:CobW family GTP-binding protein [Chungangia koreensis]|uniref:CobW family GTP-binding protein n=1 Tax=Chungangia koreensis TaxID=752657 RepID=A0ABV8XAZ3_9LACT
MIDVYLLSGFLGSGKTSLLQHLIKQWKAEGKLPAVIMNEFGKLPFDSGAVDGDVPLKELLQGCICCTGSEKTEAQIQSLLLEHNPDVILIETTGAAHPVEALDAVMSPLYADRLQFKGIVSVADSKLWLEKEKLSPQVRMLFLEQLRHAHLILLNKSDLLDENELSTVTSGIQMINDHAMVIQTVHGKLPLSFLKQMIPNVNNSDVTKTRIGNELHLSAKLIKFESTVKMENFENWVRNLPSTVYRMKGHVLIEGQKYPMLFQYAYGMVQWLPEYIKMEPQIVLIGENLKEIEWLRGMAHA